MQDSPRKTAVPGFGGAESGATGDDLATLAEVWPHLPEAIRQRIMAAVREASM